MVWQRGQRIFLPRSVGLTCRNAEQFGQVKTIGLAAAGVVIGLVPAWLLTGVLRGVLFNVVPVRPALFAGTVLALVGVALVASLVPARQASRVDPAVALRSE